MDQSLADLLLMLLSVGVFLLGYAVGRRTAPSHTIEIQDHVCDVEAWVEDNCCWSCKEKFRDMADAEDEDYEP